MMRGLLGWREDIGKELSEIKGGFGRLMMQSELVHARSRPTPPEVAPSFAQ